MPDYQIPDKNLSGTELAPAFSGTYLSGYEVPEVEFRYSYLLNSSFLNSPKIENTEDFMRNK